MKSNCFQCFHWQKALEIARLTENSNRSAYKTGGDDDVYCSSNGNLFMCQVTHCFTLRHQSLPSWCFNVPNVVICLLILLCFLCVARRLLFSPERRSNAAGTIWMYYTLALCRSSVESPRQWLLSSGRMHSRQGDVEPDELIACRSDMRKPPPLSPGSIAVLLPLQRLPLFVSPVASVIVLS